MKIENIARPTLAWLGLFALAFLNGALRELGLKNVMGVTEPLAHQLSCITGVLLWTTFTLLIWKWLKVAQLKRAALIGLCWFLATFVFETFVLNRNLTWSEILQTYDFTAGEFWGLVLLWIGVLPIAIFAIKQSR